MAKLYKYLNSTVASRLKLNSYNFGIKLSFLEEYNDPFESFLTIDFNQDPSILAYYSDVLAMSQSYLVSCFSKRPDITPMWAHYANNMAGFVLEIDEDKLKTYLNTHCLEGYQVEDIKYMSEADPNIELSLKRALVTRKPRHLHWLNQAVQYALYFYKQSYWEYENERRIIVNPKYSINIANMHLLSVAFDCIDSIIVGKNIDIEIKRILHQLSVEFGINFYEMRIGKTQAKPYFMNDKKETFIFNGNEFSQRDNSLDCGEPTDNINNICFWCTISDSDRYQAASSNIFRMLDAMGRLESVLDGYRQIDRKYNKK